MLPAVASTPAQTTAQFHEGNRQGALSLVVTPQEMRPIERQDSSGAAAGESQDERAERSAEARQRARSKAFDGPIRAPDDPAEARLGRNMNMVFDQKSGRPIIEIINPRTGEVMDRIPPESLLDRANKAELPARANLVDQTA